MENRIRARVRKYRKSPNPRLRWTSELHDHFVEAVRELGGKNEATPKRIMEVMAVRGLTISHVKSHLQMYRSMKESCDSKEFLTNYQENKQVSQELKEEQSHGKYQVEGKTGSTGSGITNNDGEIEILERANNETSESSRDATLNLDLTMCSLQFH
ncbi:hypothetical protein CASFOL_040990 [Castilleja foliolosa]|uniref:HTH myb-type domain-containing protein n=1 Tax=Castilleja foliolosa TaxID=1961234 RepID=A0ABD3BDK9_9LAMI